MSFTISVRKYLFLSLMFGLLTSGCSDKKFKTFKVEGLVKFDDGQPVRFGRIEFYQPEQDASAYGAIREDGTFSIGTEEEADGAVEGTHQVMVMQMVTSGRAGIPTATDEHQDHGTHVDSSYANFSSSGLSFVVEPHNKNVAEFIVKKRR